MCLTHLYCSIKMYHWIGAVPIIIGGTWRCALVTTVSRLLWDVLVDVAGAWSGSNVCSDVAQEGEEFAKAAERYVRRDLEKGVPSLFSNLKMLYR
jgi:hypothetical protein